MGRNIQSGDDNVAIIQANGTVPADAGADGYTLIAGQTYFAKLGGANAGQISAHVKWDALVILTISVEDCDFPKDQVTDLDNVAGNWIKEDAYPPVQGQAVGAGAVFTQKTLGVAGGAPGGAMFHVGPTGAKRNRLRIVVGGTGGKVRVATFGKE